MTFSKLIICSLSYSHLWKVFSVNILQTNFAKHFAIYNTLLVLSTQLVVKPYIAVPDLLLLASFEAYLKFLLLLKFTYCFLKIFLSLPLCFCLGRFTLASLAYSSLINSWDTYHLRRYSKVIFATMMNHAYNPWPSLTWWRANFFLLFSQFFPISISVCVSVLLSVEKKSSTQ